MNYLSRLEEFIKHLGISYNKFEDTVGVSKGSISGAIRKRRNIGSNVIENILRTYPQFSAEWWFRGRGDMLDGQESVDSVEDIENNSPPIGASFQKRKKSNSDLLDHIRLISDTEMAERLERVELTLARYILKLDEIREQVDMFEKKNEVTILYQT